MPYSLKDVFKGASVFTAGQLLTKASAFFLIPLYTRFLAPTDYGILGYLEVLLQLLTTILMFGFYGAHTRYYYEFKHDSQKVGEFLFSINGYLFAILLIICLVLTTWGEHLYTLLSVRDIPFSPFLLVIIWTMFFQILNQMVITFYLATKQFKKCAILQFLQFVMTTGFVILFVVGMNQGALGKVKGVLIGQVLSFLLFYPAYAKHFRLHISYQYVTYALMFGMPIVFHLLAGVVHQSIDRVILEKFVSLDELGLYTLGYQMGLLMSILTSSINKAWVPNYYDLMKDDSLDRAYHVKRAFYLWLASIGTICLIGSLWSREILIFLTPERFHASARIVPVILFSYVFQGLYYFAVNPIFFYKKTKILPFLTASAGFLNICLNFLFIPKFGIIGAAYATAVSHGYMAIVVHCIGKRFFDPGYDLAKIVFYLGILFTGSILIGFDEISVKTEFMKLSMLLGFVGASYLLFRGYFQLGIEGWSFTKGGFQK